MMTANRDCIRYFIIIVCNFLIYILRSWLIDLLTLQAALRAFGTVAWFILNPSLLEAATDIEWCLESTYDNSFDRINYPVLTLCSLISHFFLNLRGASYSGPTTVYSQTGSAFALDDISPFHFLTIIPRLRRSLGITSDISLDPSDRNAPSRVDRIGSRS